MTEPAPSVSVIMNCFNSGRYLREAIDSVYSQTYRDWEIIFWDNASTDDSARIAGSYDGKIRYFRSDRTVQLGQARNWAIEKSRGRFIAFLDCDDIWLPTKLEKQVKLLAERKEASLIYSNYFRLYPGKRKKLTFKTAQPEGDVFEQFLYAYPIGLLTAIVRREDICSLGSMFDEKLYLWEQYDLFMRLLYRSKAAYVDEPLAIYRIHPESGTVKFMFKPNYTEELSYVVEKFKKMDPDFEIKYSRGLAHINSKISFLKAKMELGQGRPREARDILRKCEWLDYKFTLIYLSTLLPNAVIRAILRFRERYILGF